MNKKGFGRKKRYRARVRKGPRGTQDRLLVPFTVLLSTTFSNSNTVFSKAIDYNLTSRITAFSQCYQYYKYLSLRFIVYPFADTTTSSNFVAVGYSPASEGTTFETTFTQVSQLVASCIHASQESVKSRFYVSRSILGSDVQRMFPTGTGDTTADNVQGYLHVSPSANSTSSIFVKVIGMIALYVTAPNAGADLSKRLSGTSSCRDFRGLSDAEEAKFQDLLRRREKVSPINNI